VLRYVRSHIAFSQTAIAAKAPAGKKASKISLASV